MNNKTIKFDVSTPDELSEALASHAKNTAYFADVRVLGQGVLTRQFNFPKSSTRDLIAGLKMEASEALGLPSADVEVACQITGTISQGLQGIYSAMPRQLLLEYLECFKTHPLVPISLTASAVGAVIDFLKDNPVDANSFCLVNFLKPHAVNIIVFANGKPTFFRELYDLSDSDYKDKITDTIRYSCRNSANKNINHIYFVGDLKGKDDLIKNLRKLETPSENKDVPFEAQEHVNFTGLNLFGNFVLGLAERSKLISFFSGICVISLLIVIVLAWHVSAGYVTLYEAKSKMNMGDYYRAVGLQQAVRGMDHE